MKARVLAVLTNRPQSREALCRRLGMDDRTLREHIRQLRLDGVPVCSNSKTRGYWIGDTFDQKRMAREYRKMAFDMLTTANKLEAYRAKRPLDGQIGWDI